MAAAWAQNVPREIMWYLGMFTKWGFPLLWVLVWSSQRVPLAWGLHFMPTLCTRISIHASKGSLNLWYIFCYCQLRKRPSTELAIFFQMWRLLHRSGPATIQNKPNFCMILEFAILQSWWRWSTKFNIRTTKLFTTFSLLTFEDFCKTANTAALSLPWLAAFHVSSTNRTACS